MPQYTEIKTQQPKSGVAEFRKGDRVVHEMGFSGVLLEPASVKSWYMRCDDGREGVSPRGFEASTSFLRHEPAEEQKAWEPKVGEMCEGVGVDSGSVRRGAFLGFDCDTVARIDDPPDSPWRVRRDSLRPLPASTPPARELPGCDHCRAPAGEECQCKPSEPARGDPYKCARCQTPKCPEAQFDGAIGLCGMCVALRWIAEYLIAEREGRKA